ncbi:hypothetical protein [Devosia sediminis]|uniref:Uncharacterized protein n=1 Tax=Devosia sediminis TaxID=2798801 RepID=A0A934IX89_9HYPH|nr:hypothetical protein [Devosia sediminis]MBJ3784690.1 hypothetical protein [Devosia sediminis]
MVRSVVARLGVVVLGLSAALPAAQAQELCGPAIQSLSEIVLAGRETLPPLQARRFGTRAIYLLMRYGDLDDRAINDLLAQAVESRMHGATDLDAAWRVYGGAELAPEVLASMVDTATPSAARALLLGGQEDAVMAAIAALPDGSRMDLGQQAVTVTYDQSDAVKAELAAAAESAGLDWLAAGFAAAQEDPADWDGQMKGLSVAQKDDLIGLWGWMPALHGNPVQRRSTAPTGELAEASADPIRLATWAAAQQPEISLLMAFLNQTGDYAASAQVAKALLKQFSAGELSAAGPLDAGWLVTLRALDSAGYDADAVRAQFGSLSFGLNRVDRETVGDILDWIVATDALAPYAGGESALPEEPAHLSSAFDQWDRWLALAEALRADPEAAIAEAEEADLPILAELLLAAGRRDLVIEMLQDAPPTLDTVTLADDFAGRLDRLCKAHLWHKGEAPLLSGQALYAFD